MADGKSERCQPSVENPVSFKFQSLLFLMEIYFVDVCDLHEFLVVHSGLPSGQTGRPRTKPGVEYQPWRAEGERNEIADCVCDHYNPTLIGQYKGSFKLLL